VKEIAWKEVERLEKKKEEGNLLGYEAHWAYLDGSKMRKSCLIMSHVVKKRG
jgi:hypothetical protein